MDLNVHDQEHPLLRIHVALPAPACPHPDAADAPRPATPRVDMSTVRPPRAASRLPPLTLTLTLTRPRPRHSFHPHRRTRARTRQPLVEKERTDDDITLGLKVYTKRTATATVKGQLRQTPVAQLRRLAMPRSPAPTPALAPVVEIAAI